MGGDVEKPEGANGVVIQALAAQVIRNYGELAGDFCPTSSPIEHLFWLALQICGMHQGSIFAILGDIDDSTKQKRYGMDCGPDWYSYQTQCQIGSHRVDFYVELHTWFRGPQKARVLVECDGHDYHDRTKEQASQDRKRDRELAAAGYTVLRFTGSDIWGDPCGCVKQVFDYLQGEVSREGSPNEQK